MKSYEINVFPPRWNSVFLGQYNFHCPLDRGVILLQFFMMNDFCHLGNRQFRANQNCLPRTLKLQTRTHHRWKNKDTCTGWWMYPWCSPSRLPADGSRKRPPINQFIDWICKLSQNGIVSCLRLSTDDELKGLSLWEAKFIYSMARTVGHNRVPPFVCVCLERVVVAESGHQWGNGGVKARWTLTVREGVDLSSTGKQGLFMTCWSGEETERLQFAVLNELNSTNERLSSIMAYQPLFRKLDVHPILPIRDVVILNKSYPLEFWQISLVSSLNLSLHFQGIKLAGPIYSPAWCCCFLV